MTPDPHHDPPPPPQPPMDDPHEECTHCGRPFSSSDPWTRAVKRKVDGEDEDETPTEGSGGEVVLARARSVPPPGGGEWQGTLEEEVHSLREEVAEQQRTIQELCEELDEERNASTIATNEAMTMILRLQREKAEVVLEARQFKRFAEERMEQDQQEIAELEQEVRALNDEVRALNDEVTALNDEVTALTEEAEEYRRRIEELEVEELRTREGEGEQEEVAEIPGGRDTGEEVDKYESPPTREETDHVEPQEVEVEMEEEEPAAAAAAAAPPALGGSDRGDLSRTSSLSTADSFVAVDAAAAADTEDHHHDMSSSVVLVDHDLDTRPDAATDYDEPVDRVYTIDAVHGVPMPDPPAPAPIQTAASGIVIGQDELRMLQMRLLALEEDRDSLKQALRSIRPGTSAAASTSSSSSAAAAPSWSLWEMFQNLANAPFWNVFQNFTKARLQLALQQGMGFLKTQHLFWAISLVPLIKWIVPLLFYRQKKDSRIRET